MGSPGKIRKIDPPYAIAGGEIMIDCEGFDTTDAALCAVLVDDQTAPIVALGPNRVLAVVPETKGGEVEVRLQNGNQLSPPAYITVGRKLASDLHPVARIVRDPASGRISQSASPGTLSSAALARSAGSLASGTYRHLFGGPLTSSCPSSAPCCARPATWSLC